MSPPVPAAADLPRGRGYTLACLWFRSRISFPVAVAVLPLEAVLTLTLFGILNQNAGGSPDSNKQRKAPELLGKASMPLFDFRG